MTVAVPAKAELADYEEIILNSTEVIGECLLEIQNQGLYEQAGYTRMRDYCEERFGWSRSYVARLIRHGKICTELRADKLPLLPMEGAIRPIAAIARNCKTEDEYIQKAANVCRMTLDRAGKITQPAVQATLEDLGYTRPKQDVVPELREFSNLINNLYRSNALQKRTAEKFKKKYKKQLPKQERVAYIFDFLREYLETP